MHLYKYILTNFRIQISPLNQMRLNSTTSIKAVQLSYSSHGENSTYQTSPIIVMHGLFGSKMNWNSTSRAISSKTNRMVYTVDARNHGDSPHSAEMTYSHLVEDIHLFMTDMKITKSVLIGHSMGGRAVMAFALTYPELVEKLIVVDISPVANNSGMSFIPTYINALKKVYVHSAKTLSEARKLADHQISGVVQSKSLRQFFLSNLIESGGDWKWKFNLENILKNYHHISSFPYVNDKKFLGPTYFIGGDESDYIRREDYNTIMTIFPLAKIEYISGAGHWVHSEKPAEFQELVIKYITDHSL